MMKSILYNKHVEKLIINLFTVIYTIAVIIALAAA